MKKKSKRYLNWKKNNAVDNVKTFIDSIKVLKNNKLENFDSTLNLNFHLNLNSKKSEQNLKGFYTLPNPISSKKIIAVFTNNPDKESFVEAGAKIVGGVELITQIAKTKKINFNIALATPEIALSLKKIAIILGPKKIMPTTKNNTISQNLIPIIKEFKNGKRKFYSDGSKNVHMILGKISNSEEKLIENFNYLKSLILRIKPDSVKGKYLKSIYLSGTMSPSFKLIIEKK